MLVVDSLPALKFYQFRPHPVYDPCKSLQTEHPLLQHCAPRVLCRHLLFSALVDYVVPSANGLGSCQVVDLKFRHVCTLCIQYVNGGSQRICMQPTCTVRAAIDDAAVVYLDYLEYLRTCVQLCCVL